jgi:predicted RNase H-like nuclease (RuvC/YqgF family)
MRSIIAHTKTGSRRYKGSKRIRNDDRGARVYWQIHSARYQKKESPSLEAENGFARIPHLPKIMIAKIQREIKRARVPHNSTQGTLSKEVQEPKEGKKPGRATPGTQSKVRRAMASSSKGPMSTEERLKQMETTLANLQQMLQHQLDFLENLDVEAGRRLEQLESDITMTKIGFAEELDKLNQELKNPQQDFDERMEQLEAKMAQLNSNWNKDEEK